MSKTTAPVGSVVIVFSAPVLSLTDPAEYKAAVGMLSNMVITQAEALTKDPNVLIRDTFLIGSPTELTVEKILASPVNVALALEKAKKTHEINQALKPKKVVAIKAAEPVKDDADFPPRVEAVSVADYKASIAKETTNNAVKAGGTVIKPAEVAVKPVNDSEKIMDAIFKDLKRAARSVAIVKVFAASPGAELTVDELAKGANVKNGDISSWMNATGKQIKCIEKGTSRGTYKLNPEKLKV